MNSDDFNEYVRQQSRKLFGYAFRILLNQEEAEDAVQEVFIKLWNMREKLDEYESIEALAITVTKNYCIDQLRKQKHVIQDKQDDNDYHKISSPSPQDLLESLESNNIIHLIIEHLPDLYKVIIKLRDIEGLSYEEIAEQTGQNINTLRVISSRARGMIRDEYKKYNDDKRGTGQTARKVL